MGPILSFWTLPEIYFFYEKYALNDYTFDQKTKFAKTKRAGSLQKSMFLYLLEKWAAIKERPSSKPSSSVYSKAMFQLGLWWNLDLSKPWYLVCLGLYWLLTTPTIETVTWSAWTFAFDTTNCITKCRLCVLIISLYNMYILNQGFSTFLVSRPFKK